MANQLKLGVYFFLTFLTFVSHVHLLVPPKTPVLSGFEPAAIGFNRELICDAYQTGAGTITYKWFKYSPDWERVGPIGTSQKYIFNPVTEKRLFHQGSIPSYVSGKYKCRASNSAGTRDSKWGELFVYKPCSLYTVSVSSPKPAVGSTFTVNCYIPNPSGFTVTWTKMSDASSGANSVARANSLGCRTPTISRYRWSSCSKPSSTSRTFNIQVTNAQTSDSGYWICQDIAASCKSNPVKTVVQVLPGKPQITGFPSGPVVVGTQQNLKCVASPPGDTYDWYKDNTKLTTSSSYDFQVRKESAGVYKCVATNAGGSATSSDETLIVYYKSDSVVVSSEKTSSHVGEKDKFTCTATGGKPTPTLKIYFKKSGGTPVEVTQGQERVMAKEDNQAEYYCEASTSAWTMRSSPKTYSVTFPSSKVFFTNNPTAAVQVGQVKTFRCETDESNPITNIKWYGNIIASSFFRDITTGISPSERNGAYGGKIRISDLSITATKAMNGVTVRCHATYDLTGHEFTSSADITMNVKFPPDGIQLSKTSITGREGESKTITCRTTSSSNPAVSVSVKKKLGSTEVDVTGSPSVTNGANLGKDVSVDIKLDTNRKDNGAQYTCTFTYDSTTTFRKTATVNVLWSATELRMVNKPNTPITAGGSVNIKCETDSSNSGSPETISWYRNNQHITSGATPTTRPASHGGTIYISQLTFKARKEDNQAKYECKINDQTSLKKDVTITVYFKPTKITMIKKPLKALIEKNQFQIVCETDSANPAADIEFYRKRVGENSWVELTSGISTTTTDAEYSGKIGRSALKVTANRADDQAEFRCIMKGGSIPVAQTTVTVYYPPSVSLSTNPKRVKEGNDVTLTCEASGGNPRTYRYSWYYNYKEIQNEKSRTYTDRGVKYTQTGPYRCRVVNYSPGGVADASMTIDILYKAKWNPDFQTVLTVFRKPSESVRFVLHVIANPPPTNVSWFDQFYNRPATDQGFYASKVNDTIYTLSKKVVSLDDYGQYSAKVMNDVGIRVFTFRIMKRVPPNTTLTYVKRHGTTLTARWVPLRHSYTELRISYCRIDNSKICRYHLVMNQTAGETSFVIEGSAMVKSVLVLYLEVFDGSELVFRSKPVTESREGGTNIGTNVDVTTEVGTNVGMEVNEPKERDTNVWKIVGVTVIVILLVMAVIVIPVVVVLRRRNMACFSGVKKGQSIPGPSNPGANKMEPEPMYVNVNLAFEAGESSGTAPGENEAHELHLGNKDPEYMNVTPKTVVDDAYAEPYDINENPYAELNITPDVIAEQTYSDLRHKGD